IGFETPAPTIAACIIQAGAVGVKNFSVLAAHKLLPPAMDALLSAGDLGVDGFLCPGHVTTIIGTASYEGVASRYRVPCVVAGFEPLDILQTISMLVDQCEAGLAEVQIQYSRAVSKEGNLKALAVMHRAFEPCDAVWRGLGPIPLSGLAIRPEYELLDAMIKFHPDVPEVKENPACRCGDVLRGVITPAECGLFKKACRPEHPVGPCMVSSEGSCAAYYKYSAT
ncbi:MAG: hydrogenase formation protein HypD, partial [Deltaproteobacteria bacterium]|nr:hydrogenase formation protein HypD [Deltaproteobacteria bacterium]